MNEKALIEDGAIEQFINLMTSISTERDLYGVLSAVLTGARNITNVDAGLIYLLDESKRFLAVETAQFNDVETRRSVQSVPLYVDGKRNMTNLISYTAFIAEPQRIDDIYRYSGFDAAQFKDYDLANSYRTVSVATFPLRNHEQVTVGVLALINAMDDDGKIVKLNNELANIATAFASQAAVAIDNVQLINKNAHLISMLDTTNKALAEENRELRESIRSNYDFSQIIGDSKSMQKVFTLLEKVIDSDATVLVQGETGTGKEMIAQTLHFNSKRKDKQFIAQNCAALPENLLESELFGYKKGAFSGADKDKKGLIELAHGGTLFLDEIGDMPMGLQVKLLRVLQDKEIRPLGSEESRKINVRIVAATHADLKEKIESGEFREDLYYRLNVFPVTMPPLRDRRDDIPLLLKYFLDNLSEQYNKDVHGIAPSTMSILYEYDYPGNVRDLKNIVERSVLMCENGGHILPEHLPDELGPSNQSNGESIHINMAGTLRETIESYEAKVLEQKLEECGWNQSQAARELEIGRRTLIDKINRYGINKQPRKKAAV